MGEDKDKIYSLEKVNTHLHVARFKAMASACQFLLNTSDTNWAYAVAQQVCTEVHRIEKKFSRYLKESVTCQIQAHGSKGLAIDEETYRLLCFADTLFDLSEGMFDITSGVLGRIWQFDQSDQVPDQASIDQLLPLVGWQKVKFDEKTITLPKGMALDFGGIGKEYAVDCVYTLAASLCDFAFVINLGGDLRTRGPRHDGSLWTIGIEDPNRAQSSVLNLEISQKALATSGDAYRFLHKNGVRYGHLLNPRTGWPVAGVPRSVTVMADTCTTAGMLSSLAMLQGGNTNAFLAAQSDIDFWVAPQQLESV